MSNRASVRICLVLLAALSVLNPLQSYAEEDGGIAWSEGRLRLELVGYTAFHSGRRSRTGDYGFQGSIEYEIPATRHLAFGPKFSPLFLHDQADSGEDTVFAWALGPQFRWYFKRDEFRGLFFEIGGALLFQAGRLDGNSGSINFIEEFGVGYKFKRPWHAVAKIRHISNAGFADRNAGVNTVAVGFGYTFSRGN